jgi:hypothetical protein
LFMRLLHHYIPRKDNFPSPYRRGEAVNPPDELRGEVLI